MAKHPRWRSPAYTLRACSWESLSPARSSGPDGPPHQGFVQMLGLVCRISRAPATGNTAARRSSASRVPLAHARGDRDWATRTRRRHRGQRVLRLISARRSPRFPPSESGSRGPMAALGPLISRFGGRARTNTIKFEDDRDAPAPASYSRACSTSSRRGDRPAPNKGEPFYSRNARPPRRVDAGRSRRLRRSHSTGTPSESTGTNTSGRHTTATFAAVSPGARTSPSSTSRSTARRSRMREHLADRAMRLFDCRVGCKRSPRRSRVRDRAIRPNGLARAAATGYGGPPAYPEGITRASCTDTRSRAPPST
jgi:hypothetical protein